MDKKQMMLKQMLDMQIALSSLLKHFHVLQNIKLMKIYLGLLLIIENYY